MSDYLHSKKKQNKKKTKKLLEGGEEFRGRINIQFPNLLQGFRTGICLEGGISPSNDLVILETAPVSDNTKQGANGSKEIQETAAPSFEISEFGELGFTNSKLSLRYK